MKENKELVEPKTLSLVNFSPKKDNSIEAILNRIKNIQKSREKILCDINKTINILTGR